MAYTLHSTTHSFSERLNAFVSDIRTGFVRRAAYRRTFSELAALSDRELADLGLHRSGIRQVARETAEML